MGVVYQHRTKDTNQIFYIGIGKDIYRPYSTKSRNKYWHNVVNKHGYNVELVAEELYSKCKQLEVMLISLYGRRDKGRGPLVNQTDGGEGTKGLIHTKEHTDNFIKSATGLKRSEEMREKLRLANVGKVHSDTTKNKMSIAHKGKPHKSRNIECPHCGKIGGATNMKRYHFDNCIGEQRKENNKEYLRQYYLKNKK